MAGTRYICPVDNCRFFLDEHDGAVDTDMLKAALGLANAYPVPNKRALVDSVEARLQEHIALHKPIDFMITIASLREENARLRAGRG